MLVDHNLQLYVDSIDLDGKRHTVDNIMGSLKNVIQEYVGVIKAIVTDSPSRMCKMPMDLTGDIHSIGAHQPPL